MQGKLDTEKLLTDKGVNFTSVRPVYIYGPLNYNPVEEWFFHRIKAGRPIPVPNSGQQVRVMHAPLAQSQPIDCVGISCWTFCILYGDFEFDRRSQQVPTECRCMRLASNFVRCCYTCHTCSAQASGLVQKQQSQKLLTSACVITLGGGKVSRSAAGKVHSDVQMPHILSCGMAAGDTAGSCEGPSNSLPQDLGQLQSKEPDLQHLRRAICDV